MAFWLKSLGKYWPNSRSSEVVQVTPGHYMELIVECTKKVEIHMKSLQFNHMSCQDLTMKLGSVVQMAELCIRNVPPGLLEAFQQTFKLLFRLAKEVEIFTLICGNDEWLQAAFMLTDVTEYATSLGFDLEFCKVVFGDHLSNHINHIESGLKNLTLEELVGNRQVEIERVKLQASLDVDNLLEKTKAIIEASESDTLGCQRATYLLGRLTLAPKVPTPSSVGSSSSSFQEVNYGSLYQQERLGTGATGDVHKTVWLGDEFAEKVFYGSDHPSFKNEVSILAGLSHPNVVPMFCYAMDDRKCSIVMELMEGDLFRLMQTRLRRHRALHSPFTILEVVEVILQIAEGMKYLHRRRIVHRDLKSQNILVRSTKGGNVEYVYAKVADFGLSKTKETSITFSIQTWNTGTTRWMAPEIMWDPKVQGSMSESDKVEKHPFKSDIYSFGMVCYEILTGEVPFQAVRSPSEVRSMVLGGQRPNLPDHCPLILKHLIERCWDSNASARPCFADICEELLSLKWFVITDPLQERSEFWELPQFRGSGVRQNSTNSATSLGSSSSE